MLAPKLYPKGRRKVTLEETLALQLERVSRNTGTTLTQLVDEAVKQALAKSGEVD